MKIELYNKHPKYKEYFYTELEMPASRYVIHDALHRVRFFDGDTLEFNISECPEFPEIKGMNVDRANIFDLNNYAYKLNEMKEYDLVAMRAVFTRRQSEGMYKDGIMMGELINLTYGLEGLPSLVNINNTLQLGQFIIDNDMNTDLEGLDASVLDLIDRNALGIHQADTDMGIFIDGYYIATANYELPDIYKDSHLKDSSYIKLEKVFALEISKAPDDDMSTEESAEWITLPINKNRANLIAQRHGEQRIESCAYYGFDSAIPQIDRFAFKTMDDFDKLNELAEKYLNMSNTQRIKYKAVLDRYCASDLMQALTIADSINHYDFYPYAEREDQFLREYFSLVSDTRLDSRWTDAIHSDESENLLRALDASITEYGVVSNLGGCLFEPVDYYKPLPYTIDSRDFDVVEMCGQLALYVDASINPNDIPEGLYKYEFRHGDEEYFSTLEKNVFVNHSGTLITRKPIDLGKLDYLSLNLDTSPNFIGESAKLEDFLEDDFDEKFSQDQSGEMSLS